MGPLAGVRVVEFAGNGPVPMCAMILADMGARVLRIERPGRDDLGMARPPALDFTARNRDSLAPDLKTPAGRALVAALIGEADALIECFRPGVMERLGLGPEPCLASNPRLVAGRLRGGGRPGPRPRGAGHPLTSTAPRGAGGAAGGGGGPPAPPLNLVGDYGGGALHMAAGLLGALLHVARGGAGQVVEVSILGGADALMTATYGLHAAGLHGGARGTNVSDSGAPFYDVYECADHGYVSVAALEKKFRATLFARLGLDAAWVGESDRRERWPELREKMAAIFRTRSRDAWCALLEGTDACFAPVLSMAEAPAHPQNRAAENFIQVGGALQPAPGPRFSRTVPPPPRPPEAPGAGGVAALRAWGWAEDRITALGVPALGGTG